MPRTTVDSLEHAYKDIEQWDTKRIQHEQECLYTDFNANLMSTELFERAYAILNGELNKRRHQQYCIDAYDRAMGVV